MSTSLQKTSTTSFWKKPEGTTGKILLGAALAVGGYFGLQYAAEVMTLVRNILENGFHAAIAGVGLFLISSPIWSTKVRVLGSYALRSVLRGITSLFVTIDPIGIQESYRDEKMEDQQELKKQIAIVEGVKRGLDDAIAENRNEAQAEFKIAGQAKRLGKRSALAVASRQHGRLLEANVEYDRLLKMTQMHLSQLYKWDEICTVTVADLNNAIKVNKKKRQMIMASYKAMSATKRILKQSEAMELFQMSIEQQRNDFDAKFGEIEQFRKDSQGIFESFDLENGVMEDDMIKKLEDAEKRADELLLGPMAERVSIPEDEHHEEELVTVGARNGRNDTDDLYRTK